MLRAVLFDLDGTLLPIDTMEFLQKYLRAIGEKVSPVMPPETFVKGLLQATDKMVSNLDPSLTNEEVFWQNFKPFIKDKENEVLQLIDQFYREDFYQLGQGVQSDPQAVRVVEELHRQGLTLVLATNSIFPREAIVQRLSWGGLDPHLFNFITSYENMHFCKPNIQYYSEIIDVIGEQPEECLMVGNDAEEDMIAGKIGIRTFFAEGYSITRNPSKSTACDFRGRLEDIPLVIKELK